MNSKKLTLGILDADELAPEVEKKFGSYSNMFQDLFNHNEYPFIFNSYQVTQETYPQNINDCDAYLITGSKASAYENTPWIIKLKEFIRQCQENDKKLVGICFGHQIIAEALGGRVNKSQNGWGVGLMSSAIEVNQSWMQPELKSYSLLVSHQDQVEQLPEKAIRLAASEFCQNSSFQLGKTILTFQGHPEFSEEYLLQIMNKRRNILGEETYNTALNSLEYNTDESIIAGWINNFLH